MVDTEIEFYIRTKDSLDDMLYEVDSSFVKRESGKQFDSIDIIFFEGDANLRPWSDNANKVYLSNFLFKVDDLFTYVSQKQ